MLFNRFQEINCGEIKLVSGGLCHCFCNRQKNGTDIYNIGKAKSLEECSTVCIANEWKIDKCDNISKKEDK